MGLGKAVPKITSDAIGALSESLSVTTDGEETWEYECTLVTPMFGGGVRAGEVDLAMPIRPTAIRGQLRFWWRLLNQWDESGRMRSPEELFTLERDVWGGLGNSQTLTKSLVSVRVFATDPPKIKAYATHPERNGGVAAAPNWEGGPAVGYVLFPSQGIVKNGRFEPGKEPKCLMEPGFRFVVRISVAHAAKRRGGDIAKRSVRQAMEWFSAFGGIGARTRRGCGALAVRERTPTGIRDLLVPDVSAVPGCTLHVQRERNRDAFLAWTQAAEALRHFRQGMSFARDEVLRRGKQQPAMSRWPEPDAIRRITQLHSTGHAPLHPATRAFPRAMFGLPLIVKFKDDRANPPDPPSLQIRPVPEGQENSSDRMASSLVIRPMRVDESLWRAGVLVLPHEHLPRMGLELEADDSSWTLNAGDWWSASDAALIPPMSGLPPDPLEAFVAYFVQAQNPRFAKQPNMRGPSADGSGSVLLERSESKHGNVCAATEEVYERPQLKFHPRNDSFEVKPQVGKTFFLSGDDAARLRGALSHRAVDRLITRGLYFNRLQLTASGTRFVRLTEYEE